MSVDIVISVLVAMIVRVTMATVMMMVVMVVAIWTVRMIQMMVVVMIRELVFAEITSHQENRAQTGDQHTGDYSQPGIKALRHDVLGCVQGHRAKQIYSSRMRRGYNQSEQKRMLHSSTRTH